MTTATAAAAQVETGTNATAGARRIAAAFARARADGRAALIPYVVAGYPDAEASFRIALAAADVRIDPREMVLHLFHARYILRCDDCGRVLAVRGK